MTPTATVLRVERLRYHHEDGSPLFVDWSACFGAGVTALRGDTGAGKTTLLRLLSGQRPLDGDVAVRGIRLADDPAAYRREVFWRDPTAETLHALAPTAWFDALRRDHPRFDDAALLRHVDGFSLPPHLAKPMYQLSTGSRRKVMLAAALASGAAAVLLDDPTSALDGPSITHLIQVLRESTDEPARAWIVAGYDAVERVPGAALVDLPG